METREPEEILNYWNINIFSTNNETILHYAARHDDPEVARYACDPKHGIKLNQRSTHELRTALHIAVKGSKVEIARILLENGARDEWGDLFGTYARDYIRDDEIGVLFKKHGFSLQYNYETKIYEPGNITTTKEIQPAKRGNFTSPTTREVSATTTTEPQTIPYRTVSFESSAEQQLNSPRLAYYKTIIPGNVTMSSPGGM